MRVHDFSTVAMDTLVNVRVVSAARREAIEPKVQQAFGWFERVEQVCSRFEPTSELMQFTARVDEAVPVSTMLLLVVDFALQLATQTDGAFDPTVGAALERAGYATNYRRGSTEQTQVEPSTASFRDVHVDRRRGTIRVTRRVALDLNSVAKGLAIDLATQALSEWENFCVEAGGDVFARGHNAQAEPWHVGIQHPRAPGLLARTLRVTDMAVCTSADTERGAHVLDARTSQPVADLASVTVVAPTALAADGLSTAAMILGRERGLRLLQQHEVEGLLVAPDGSTWST